MGKFDFEVPTAFIRQLGKLGDVDRVAPIMINEAMPILERNLKSEISRNVGKSDVDPDRGAMLDSVKKTKAGKVKGGGYFATVRPTGLDSKGVRNMEKLAWLEYGTSKQTPTPILTKAIKDSDAPVLDKMQEVFEREVQK